MSIETDNVDSNIASFIDDLVDCENNYKSSEGVYVQILPTHTTIPTYDESLELDNSDGTAKDENISVDALFSDLSLTIPSDLKACIRVDRYNGPDGDGFVIHIDCIMGSTRWHKSINHGPEEYRSEPWGELNLP